MLVQRQREVQMFVHSCSLVPLERQYASKGAIGRPVTASTARIRRFGGAPDR
jgi:hypothetical protein